MNPPGGDCCRVDRVRSVRHLACTWVPREADRINPIVTASRKINVPEAVPDERGINFELFLKVTPS